MSLTDRDQLEKLESRIDNLYALFERVNDRPDLTDEVGMLMERVSQLEAEVASLTEQVKDDSKLSRVEAIVEAAENKADATMSGVVMTAKDIRAATGVSTSHAYRYIDELPLEFEHFDSRDQDEKERGIVVDLDAVRTKTE